MRNRPPITFTVLRHVIGGLAVLALYGAVMVRIGSPHEQTLLHLFVGIILLSISTARTWWKEYRNRDDYVVWENMPSKVAGWKLQPGELPPAIPRQFPRDVDRLPVVRDVNDKSKYDD